MKEQSTTRGFAVLSAASLIVKLVSLLFLPLLNFILPQEAIGSYNFTYTIFTFIYVLSNSGIPVAISKLVSELIAQNNYKDAIKSFKMARFLLIVIGLVMSLIMMLIAAPITRRAGQEDSELAIIVLAPTVLITSVMSAYRGYFQGRGNMTPTGVSQIVEQIVHTIFSLVCAALLIKISIKVGVAGATVGTTVGALVACIYLFIKYEKTKKFRIPKDVDLSRVKRLPNKTLFRKLLTYGIPITLSVGLQQGGNFIDSLIAVNRLMDGGYTKKIAREMYGTIGQTNSLINVPIAIVSALSVAVLPAISAAMAVGDRKLAQEKINQAMKICFIIVIPSAIGLAVLSKPIYGMLFPDAVHGAKLMKLACLIVILMSIVQIQTTILQGLGKMNIVTATMFIGIVVKIITSYSLMAIPSINQFGSVAGNIMCFTVPLVLNYYYIKNTTRFRLNVLKYSLKPFIAAVAMGILALIAYIPFDIFISQGASRLAYVLPTIILMMVAAFVYAYAMIYLGGITKNDLNSISPKLVRIIPAFMKKRMR
ncbi:MAG TPA: sporulation protein SpoVB [Clostridium sp.]|jgi:stage V sporulation protein B|nr:polysaccharide biosynthesis protein [Clostridia bacterium]HCW05706.1 sporulation protein SpoVB [Clostridium sp.]